MPELIGNNKDEGFVPTFDTYIPTLAENANIQEALKVFYFGNSLENQSYDNNDSLYRHLLTLNTNTGAVQSNLDAHFNDATDVHGIGSTGGEIVGTAKEQTLTNKRLDSPKINENATLTATSTQLNILNGVTATTSEINILDGVTSTTAEINVLDGITASTTQLNYLSSASANVQTQLNLKSPIASPTFTGSVNLPDDTSFGGKRLFIQSTQPLSADNGDVWIKIG
jgi:hypothetical protein